ncbi:MAG: hypothetical protein QOE11_2817 [Solirubrobacteraceae bacterium]|nr:hypothetical protein [Solirubrobacteraceae bacterium]
MAHVSAATGLEGSVAVVTGACGRLGPIWVDALAQAGATVVGLDAAPADRAPAGLAGFEQVDVTSRDAVDAAVARVTEHHGVAHVLVNNAGIDQPPLPGARADAIDDVPMSEFLRVLEVNVGGVFNMTRAVGGAMAAQGRGSIVNIGSLYASIAPDPSFYDHMDLDPPFLKPPAYGASKAGVINLTRYFARLWGPRGVRVNALSPGGVLGDQDPDFRRKYIARVPLRRMAEPGDLAGPLLFLASDASRYVTGHELRVEGGFTA